MRLQKHERDIRSSAEVKLSQLSIISQIKITCSFSLKKKHKYPLQWSTYDISEGGHFVKEFKSRNLKLRIF